MCVNYRPPTQQEIAEVFNARVKSDATWPTEVWKDYSAPIIRTAENGDRETLVATYGMVPRRHIPTGVRPFDTMNARIESIGEKRSFSKAWRTGQTCLVPMRRFYEPNYESGKAVRWSIDLVEGKPFAVAGLWRQWRESDGSTAFSFTQLTINADEHQFMRRFHKPGDEKRSLVIIPESDYDAWLACRDPELARSFMTLYPANLMTGRPEPKQPKTDNTTPLLL